VRVNDDVSILPLSIVRDGQTFAYNATLILDAAAGPTLVDAGLPGQLDQIAAAMAESDVAVADLKRVILTHQDVDHVGSLRDVVEASGARVLAHEVEAPFIDGTDVARFRRPAVLEARPEMRPIVERIRTTPVDETLRDGSRLDIAGGVRVVFTPGHTVGHLCLYLERTRTVIAGDALTASEGRLAGPMAAATEDMATAAESVRKLAELDVSTIVCYHGGVVADDANGQLRRVADELGASREAC
jgi:glyoxylase-like metal-dependent hydrolase (beta-lactamase superfamily II)